MAYVGLVPQQSLLSSFSETFSGDASTLQFTLSRSVSKASDLEVFIANTQQMPTVAYTAAGTQLLFASAPAAGTNNITVIYRAGSLQTINVTNNSFNQGTVVAPSVNSAVATTTGIYWPTTTDLGLVANGALKVLINDSSASTSTGTGAVVVTGGVGISGNVYTGGDMRINSATAASSASTGALVVTGGVGIGGKLYVTDDLQVAGDFTVNGTFTTTASDSLAITDPFVFLAADNAGDALDQGFVGRFVDGGSVTRYTGLFRDVTDGNYKLFTNLTNQPTTVVDTANASFAFANIDLGILTSSNITAGNIRTATNTISSVNANGNIDLSPNGTGNVNLNSATQVNSSLQATQFISNISTGTAPLTVTSTTQVANLNVATAGTAGTVTTAAQPNITSVGTLSSLGVSGAVTASTLVSNVTTGTAPFTVTSTTQVANLNVATAGSATTAGTVTTAAQPNITSVGTLSSLGVSGAVTASTLVSNVASGTAPFTVTSTTQVANLNAATAGSATTAGTVTTAAQPNITSVGTLSSLSVTGNISAGNVSSTFYPTSGSGTAGIIFPINPGGGGGDGATIKYYASAGETTVLELGVTNDADDTILLTATGGTKVTGNITAPVFISNVATGTAPFTVTSTTQVANLNVATAGSATTATTATNWGAYGAVPAAGTSFGNANTIGRSDANGYTYFYYINSNTGNSENPTVSQVIVTNGSDNFYRKASIAHVTSSVQSNASGNWSINATNLSTNRTNWSTNGTISAVVGQLCWKHYGNNHTIFDASNSTNPGGGAVNNTNPDVAWTGTYPTLMGWNGSNTYGVRVDSARYADQAKYADLAEKYLADKEYPVGTVLMIGGTAEVTLAEKDSRAIVGVISENGFVMNADLQGEHVTAIGYIGRVPCRVMGKIKKGDFLIVGDRPGIAVATPYSNDLIGKLIGKSLANHDSDDEGIIEILVGRL